MSTNDTKIKYLIVYLYSQWQPFLSQPQRHLRDRQPHDVPHCRVDEVEGLHVGLEVVGGGGGVRRGKEDSIGAKDALE